MPHTFPGPAVETYPLLLWRSEDIGTAVEVPTVILENKRHRL